MLENDKDYFKLLEYLELKLKSNETFIEALTHSSFAKINKKMKYNERVEFLGDAVLQLVISEHIFLKYKDKKEGELTKLRSLIVCENSLYEVAKKWNLGDYIIMSKGEELTGGRERISILADCVEAIIAAVYLDKGYKYSREFILKHLNFVIEEAVNNKIILDYKTKLQELLQKNGEVLIEYRMIKHEGPPHKRKFFLEVAVNNEVIGFGEGYSKKEGEQMAATEALKKLEGKNE